MANYCYNSFHFWGPKDQIEKFYSILSEGDYIDDILTKAGYEDLVKQLEDHRHYITWMEKPTNDGVVSEFGLDTESAWVPMARDFDLLFTSDEAFKDIQYVYTAEEPGMGIFVNTDEIGEYFPVRYRLYWYYKEDDEYYESFEEAIDSIKARYTGIDLDGKYSAAEIEQAVEKYIEENSDNPKYKDDDGVSINEYWDKWE